MEAIADDIVKIGDLELHFRLEEPGATVFEFVVPAQARVPAPHYHAEADELIYGLSGRLTVTMAGQKTEIGPGEAIFIPRGTVHHHENHHAETARVLTSITPGTIRRAYFEELAEVVNAHGRPDAEKVKAIMARHGLIGA
ncbi:cupin domain-containing protein [Falsirhodobacter sp. 20TX0035]|uniref:cupin domain-containing protein n=1 Tax=Falsirhodobacter sp. 20TX0035 TaxID=3022019 RepID=UPI00233045FC|nr:cupin domain-containing protein [Falsirhodobacter sp. 20TX0035]MDB6454124.1 cupin domain-containing protein [Falsirhodobacter sp. 20TX0035]